MDYKLELVLVPVSDVDRAKAFYTEQCGFHLDVDHQAGDLFRVVQMTPPGSACSITIGKGVTDAAPGSMRGTHLVVTDIAAARQDLAGRASTSPRSSTPRRDGWSPGRTRRTGTTGRSPSSERPGRQHVGPAAGARQDVRRARPGAIVS